MTQFLSECLRVLSTEQAPLLERLCERTYLTAQRMNITARKSLSEIVFFHVADSLSLLPEAKAAKRVCDVGTGGGFPGLVLAAVCPEVEFVLMDATQKKVDAIGETAAELGLLNVRAVCARAEEAGRGAHREAYDLVVSRALAALPMLSELCLPLVKRGGSFAAMKGRRAPEEILAAQAILEKMRVKKDPLVREERLSSELFAPLLSLAEEEEHQALSDFCEMTRYTLLFEKSAPTPERYPRPFREIKRGKV